MADAHTPAPAAGSPVAASPAASRTSLVAKAKAALATMGTALAACEKAQREAVSALHDAWSSVKADPAALQQLAEEAGLKWGATYERNRHLAFVKAMAPDLANDQASFLARILRGMDANAAEVEATSAVAFLEAKGGLKAVASLAPKATAAGDASAVAFKRDCVVAKAGHIGTAANVPVTPAAGGFVVVLARPDGKGGLVLNGTVDDEKLVQRVVRLVAKGVDIDLD